MNNQEIKLARQKYNNLQLEKQKYEKMKQRILELEQNPIVKEYIQINNNIDENFKLFDEEYIINCAFAYTTVNTNMILICMDENDFNIYYRDLETLEYYKVSKNERIDFEKNKKIVYLNIYKFAPAKERIDKFNKLRNEFFRELLIKPQEEVVKQFIKKYQNRKH